MFYIEGGIMTSLIETRPPHAPRLSSRSGARLVSAAPALWRVLDRGGRVIGHLQAIAQADGIRFRARRFHTPTHSFRDLGDFWNADDAVECLRFGR
jgi:hypothetical protein